jgi:hypothetical protein
MHILRLTTALFVLYLFVFGAASLHADRLVPFKVGEVLTYEVSWAGYVSGGMATLAIKERRPAGPGHAAYYMVAEAKPSSLIERLYHLYYKAESIMDTETLRPAFATMYSDERGRTRLRTMKFLSNGQVDVEVKTRTLIQARVQVPPQSLDPISALYTLRATPLRQGQTTVLTFVNNGTMYRLRAYAAGRESLASGLGPMPAWRLELAVTDDNGRPATTRALTLWLSDDARRLPLRVQVGLPVGNFSLNLARASR